MNKEIGDHSIHIKQKMPKVVKEDAHKILIKVNAIY